MFRSSSSPIESNHSPQLISSLGRFGHPSGVLQVTARCELRGDGSHGKWSQLPIDKQIAEMESVDGLIRFSQKWSQSATDKKIRQTLSVVV
jgi:hypothetical protein